MGGIVIKVAVICPSKDMTCGIGNYTASLVNALGKSNLISGGVMYSSEVNEKVLDFRPDIVNFQWEYALYDAAGITRHLNILRKNGIRTDITLHGWSNYDPKNRILESMFDSFIVPNRSFEKHLRRRGINKPVSVIPIGTEKYGFQDTDRAFIRDAYGIAGNEPVVGAFGFLEYYKNYHTILKALSDLKGGTLLLSSYSKDENNSYAADLQQIAVNLGVKFIHLKGYMEIDTVVKVLHACDMLVYNYTDVFTYSSSAAIRTGISSMAPVIASDITFFDDIPDVEEGGPVYKIKNGLTQSIQNLMGDPRIRDRMVENTKQYITENSWENVAKKHAEAWGGIK